MGIVAPFRDDHVATHHTSSDTATVRLYRQERVLQWRS